MVEALSTLRLQGHRLYGDSRESFLHIIGNQRVMEQMGEHPHRLLVNAFHDKCNHWETHGFGLWLFTSCEYATLVGMAGVNHAMVNGRPEVELAYAVHPHFWHEGYGMEMAEAVVDTAFTSLDLMEMVCFARPSNTASHKIMQKLGFIYEQNFMHGGEVHKLSRLLSVSWQPNVGNAGTHQRREHTENQLYL